MAAHHGTQVLSPRAQVLKDLQENPKASQHHLRNPQIMAKIQKLVSAGIVRMS